MNHSTAEAGTRSLVITTAPLSAPAVGRKIAIGCVPPSQALIQKHPRQSAAAGAHAQGARWESGRVPIGK
jgi:hypothetical protein